MFPLYATYCYEVSIFHVSHGTHCWQDAARHVYCAQWIKQRCNKFKQRTCWRLADSSSESSWSFVPLSSALLSHRTFFLEGWSHLPAPSSSDWFWLRLPVWVLARLLPCWRAIERESYIYAGLGSKRVNLETRVILPERSRAVTPKSEITWRWLTLITSAFNFQ